MKVTITRQYRDKETLRLYELSTIVSNIQAEVFGRTCGEIRQEYPLSEVQQRLGDTDTAYEKRYRYHFPGEPEAKGFTPPARKGWGEKRRG